MVEILKFEIRKAFKNLYNLEVNESEIILQTTKIEYVGDFTFVVFPFLKQTKKSPEVLGNELGEYISKNSNIIASYNVIKGFLNIEIQISLFLDFINNQNENFILISENKSEINNKPIVVEFSSPNTNKPLHLGHIRNNLLGESLSRILSFVGHKVVKVNLVNDRGIHICKSMLAWKKWGQGETPTSSGIKGDHLVGKYYVLFDKEYKNQIKKLVNEGTDAEEAARIVPIIKEAQDYLLRWENNDKEIVDLWKMMNGWVYDGFEVTYKNLGITFDKTYYESDTYLLGKNIIKKGVEDNIFFVKPDNSVWVDLTSEKLDEKLLLRSDGTSVYITQDIGTALQRYEEYNPSKLIYVVGNEQEYHFQVLRAIFKKMKFDFMDIIQHYSYGMVELPEGKMKSREGTVVDADDLMQEMVETARITSLELGKTSFNSQHEADKHHTLVGMGALKYFILKVDPKKNMLFNPKESIDFNGNTGTFIQYTHARICSILRKAEISNFEINIKTINSLKPTERNLIRKLFEFSTVVYQASNIYSPALICNYTFELASLYNQFYHECNILKEEDENIKKLRLAISKLTKTTINKSMNLLGIEVPEFM